jgi:hypothetical protein
MTENPFGPDEETGPVAEDFGTITAEQLENRDAIKDDFIDEVTATMLEEQYQAAEKEGKEIDFANVWGELDPESMKVILETESLAADGRQVRSWRYIDDMDHIPRDENGKLVKDPLVPSHLKLWWVSPRLARGGFGWRGFRKVRRTPETLKWVPNADQFGSGPWIEAGGCVLCGMDRNRWLRRKAAEHQSVSTQSVVEDSDKFQNAMANAHSRLGISKKRAQQLDRHDGAGVTLVRTKDPDGPHDVMTAEDSVED